MEVKNKNDAKKKQEENSKENFVSNWIENSNNINDIVKKWKGIVSKSLEKEKEVIPA